MKAMTDPAEIRAEGRRLLADERRYHSTTESYYDARHSVKRWLFDNADVLLADPAPVGLTEGERKIVEAGRHGYHHVLYQLVAIIDRLVHVCHGIYHHGCPSCDRQDPEDRE